MTHICVSKPTTIGSDNGLSPGRRQAIIWSNAGILLIGTEGRNLSEILIEIHIFSLKNAFENIVWEMAAILSRPQCVNMKSNMYAKWRIVACFASNRYLNHCWFIVYWTRGNTFHWHLKKVQQRSLTKRTLEMSSKILVMLHWYQCVKCCPVTFCNTYWYRHVLIHKTWHEIIKCKLLSAKSYLFTLFLRMS